MADVKVVNNRKNEAFTLPNGFVIQAGMNKIENSDLVRHPDNTEYLNGLVGSRKVTLTDVPQKAAAPAPEAKK